MSFVPTRVFFTKGVGRHKEQLSSFELALRDAKIAATNIVTVSSILPPRCKRVPLEEGLKAFSPGQIIFTVLARNACQVVTGAPVERSARAVHLLQVLRQ